MPIKVKRPATQPAPPQPPAAADKPKIKVRRPDPPPAAVTKPLEPNPPPRVSGPETVPPPGWWHSELVKIIAARQRLRCLYLDIVEGAKRYGFQDPDLNMALGLMQSNEGVLGTAEKKFTALAKLHHADFQPPPGSVLRLTPEQAPYASQDPSQAAGE